MAISPLALGIGLQGKYDYKRQAALDLARERGRAKAEAAAEEGKEKKRAEVRKMIVNIKPEGLLPFQQKIMDDGMADLLVYAGDNPEDLSGVTQRSFQLIAKNKAYRDVAEGYKRLSLQQGGMPADAQALRVVGTLSDPKAIQEELAKFGPATSIALTGDQLILDNPKYTGTGESIAKSINSMQFDLLQGAPVITVGDKKFAGADINKNVPALITANIMSDANRKKSAINDYLQFSIENDIPYDFSTPEGSIDFLNKTTEWVQQKAQTDVDTRSKQINVTPSKGTTVNIGAAQNPAMNSINYSEEKDINVGKGKFRVMGGAVPNMEDAKLTLPYDSRTFYAKNGERVEKSGLTNITYNRPALGYVAKEDYNFPATKIKLQNGQYNTIPAKKFYKGQPLLDQYALAMAQQGKAKAGYVVFGMGVDSKGSPQEIIRDYSDLGISKFLNASAYDRNLLNQIDENAAIKKQELQAKIDSYYQSNIEPTPKIDIPKKQGDVNKDKPAPKENVVKPTKRTDPSKFNLKPFPTK